MHNLLLNISAIAFIYFYLNEIFQLYRCRLFEILIGFYKIVKPIFIKIGKVNLKIIMFLYSFFSLMKDRIFQFCYIHRLKILDNMT